MSGMMVLPVVAATAWMTSPSSASLKCGVIFWPLFCALTTPPAVTTRMEMSAAIRPAWKGFLFIFVLLLVPGVWFDRTLVHRNIAIGLGLRARSRLLGFGGDLRQIQYQILLTPVSGDADTRISRGTQGAEDFLGSVFVVQRGAIDGRHQVARAQADAGEGLAVGARIYPEAAHLAAREHR